MGIWVPRVSWLVEIELTEQAVRE